MGDLPPPARAPMSNVGAQFRLGVAAVCVGLLSSCGGHSSQSSPVSPSTVNAVTSVAVSLPAGHSPSLLAGETAQLHATATYTDGTTGDCTALAVWVSSDERVVRFNSQHPGEITVVSEGAATLTASCGPKASGELAVRVLTVSGVTVSLPAGHGALFTPGEKSQLRAIATYSDLSSGECTAAAQWVSSNEPVIRLTGVHPGEIVSVAGGNAAVTATCGAATGQLTLTVGRGVRIGGGMDAYPNFILTSGNFFLTATIINADGRVDRDCGSEAVWTSSNPAVATIQSISKRLQQRNEGEATITATCALATGQLLVRIGHYVLSGVVRAADGSPVGGALIDDTLTASDGSYDETQTSERPTVRVSKVAYETLVQAITWNREPAMTQDLVLSPIPGVFRQGEGKLCISGSGTPTYEQECRPVGATSQDVHTFTVPRDGTLRLATHWSAPSGSEVDHNLIADLKCDGTRVTRSFIASGLGGGFSVSATASCHYELTLTNGTVAHVLPYQYTLSLQ